MSIRGPVSIQRFVDRIGAPGVIGIGLLLFVIMYLVSAALPARERLAELERERVSAGNRPAPEPRKGADVEGELAAFYAFFSSSDSIAGALTRVSDAAARSGLALDAAEYRLLREGALRLARYEVTLPVRGTYAQVRSIVSALLEDFPQLAVEDIAVKRESAAAAAIDARLRLSIYLVLP